MRAKQLEVLNEVARIATLGIELRPMLQRITDTLANKFEWEFVALVTIDPQQQTFLCEALTSTMPTEIYVGYGRPLGSGVVGTVAATGKPLVLDDVNEFPNYVETMPGARSEICVPVKHHGQIVAVLNLESRWAAAFHDQLPLLETVADTIAGAIASAQLFDELHQRARLMEMMSEVSRTALDATDLEEVVRHIVEYIHERFPLQLVSVETTRVVHSSGVSSDEAAALNIPIRFRKETIGLLKLESTTSDVFTPATVLAFEAFADQVAGAIHFASLNAQLAATKTELEQKTGDLEQANAHLASAIETLHRISTQDGLTGVANRRHFDETLGLEWRRSARSRAPLSLLMLDIDYFKAFNDSAGHQAGDDCLRRVAQTLRDTVHRAADFVARYGGEEFAILLPETDAEHALRVAERLRECIEALAVPHPASPLGRVTASIGVATCVPPRDCGGTAEFVGVADEALYDAKRLGRNRVVM